MDIPHGQRLPSSDTRRIVKRMRVVGGSLDEAKIRQAEPSGKATRVCGSCGMWREWEGVGGGGGGCATRESRQGRESTGVRQGKGQEQT